MNMKLAIAAGTAMLAIGAFARPHHGPGGFRGGPGPGFHHRGPGFHHGGPAFHHGGPRFHHGGWGRGGRNFWPVFVGGVVGGLVYDAVTYPRTTIVTTPTVVTTPVVTTPTVVTTPVVTTPVTTTQSVWVEGRYIDQVQANGVVVRVWQPGHYEQRTVYVQ